jgi:hypothetical protein
MIKLIFNITFFLILFFGFKSFSQDSTSNLEEQFLGCWLISDMNNRSEFAGYMEVKNDGTLFNSISKKISSWKFDGNILIIENFIALDTKDVAIYSNVQFNGANLITGQIHHAVIQRRKLLYSKIVSEGSQSTRCDQNFLGS